MNELIEFCSQRASLYFKQTSTRNWLWTLAFVVKIIFSRLQRFELFIAFILVFHSFNLHLISNSLVEHMKYSNFHIMNFMFNRMIDWFGWMLLIAWINLVYSMICWYINWSSILLGLYNLNFSDLIYSIHKVYAANEVSKFSFRCLRFHISSNRHKVITIHPCPNWFSFL